MFLFLLYGSLVITQGYDIAQSYRVQICFQIGISAYLLKQSSYSILIEADFTVPNLTVASCEIGFHKLIYFAQ